ncbi:hypothetical protein H1D32_05630 [Anaerobacillus sp. CMMVII]|uniref:NAD(P)-binding domain-containing protein n=1 Tax=Anaerobacillus sp. CMMVII TaxID=2755588 RepID=UPI0021B714DD|nr:NAD(P)-binding domain-containing protein [Anaerobacillus sp. CMMVII]MCT8137270.1 hypothetical protein [Anaerobacillus sp. CMMVII]
MYLVVGIGKLAQSILKLNSYQEKIYVYSRTKTKVDEIEDERVSYIGKDEFHKASHVFLMLPASEIVPFLESNHSYFKEDVIFYSFATALLTKDVSTIRNVIPCKLAGHAKQMVEDQSGLFVVPEGVNCDPLVHFLVQIL